MFKKPQSTHVLGLDVDAFFLKGVAVSQVRGKVKLDQTFEFFIESQPQETENVKPLYMPEQDLLLETLTENNLVVTAADTQDVLIRPLELKLKKDKDIDATLAFQVEPILPYPVENAIIDKILFSKDKEGSKLTIFCIRKDHLSQHIDNYEKLKIKPEVISAAPQALVLFSNRFVSNKNEAPFFAVHLGIEHSFAVLIDQQKLIAAQVIPSGLNQLIETLVKEKGLDKPTAFQELFKESYFSAKTEDASSIKNTLDGFRMSMMRTLYSLAKQFKGREVNDIILTGPGATLDMLPEILCSQLNKTILLLKEDPEFGATKKQLLNYALPIGEALSALPGCTNQINFRLQEFLYPEPWKRIKKPITLYFLLCLGIAISLFLFGKAYTSYQEGKLRQQYLHLLNMMNKPYTTFEKELAGKTYSGNPNSETLNVADLSLDQIKNRLGILQKELKATPQTFPLQPNIPLVSDVLAWISSHPNFIGKKQDDTKDISGSMQIKSFNYTIVKRPDPTKKQERYQVKVEMEFSSPTPKMAREFHDALIAPNDMVDSKGEIKWNSNRDLYRTSFFLKDKTAYPNL